MTEFLKVKTALEVLSILDEILALPAETVSLEQACGRSVASDITAPESVPHFARATMDGFAVHARDTFGASESLPALLEISGEVAMGVAAGAALASGKVFAIPTGGMLPGGADAVVMVEYTHVLDDNVIEVTRPVAPGENVLNIGDDIQEGETIFERGWRLRPQDIGVLAALGITGVSAFRRPRVAVISTGDEIVPIDTNQVPPGKVRDINTFALAAQLGSAGALASLREKVPDTLEDLVSACIRALSDHDMIVLSGGSSVGARDYTVRVLERLPESRLLVHGVAIRPGKPIILGLSGKKLFWGLPGQPASALITCLAFVVPSLERLQGRRAAWGGQSAFRAVLNRRMPSVHGRTDFVPVAINRDTPGLPEAVPIFGKSGAISLLARAQGYVIVPEHVEGYDKGTEVSVHPFSY